MAVLTKALATYSTLGEICGSSLLQFLALSESLRKCNGRSVDYFFLIVVMNSLRGNAGNVVSRIVPREPNSIETLAIVLLSGASTILTKSYGPRVAYCEITLAP